MSAHRGRGLHSGVDVEVEVGVGVGASALVTTGARWALGEPMLVRADAGVAIRVGGEVVELVEHAAAAMGGLGLHRGVEVRVSGGEVPLLDGGAATIARALVGLGVAPSVPRLRVVRAFERRMGASHYRVEPASEVEVRCEIDFAHPMIGRQAAEFHGDPGDFLSRIAAARTFGFARDHAALLASGRARAVDLSAVVVFDDDGLYPGCTLASADEPARHKLLDLIGDLALFGGPPRGRVSASRPGHAATHAFLRAALAASALALTE